MDETFRIGLSVDFSTQPALLLEPALDEVFGPFSFVEYDFFENKEAMVAPEEIKGFDAVITTGPQFAAVTFQAVDRLAVIARWGGGYDMINVPDCTEANVLLAITTDSVRRPVSEAILTLLLALAKKLPAKDKLVRNGRWDLKAETSGLGFTGKIVGSVGVGNIGADMFRLLQPFNLGRMLAFDPFVSPERIAELSVELVDLPTLFKESDFIAINCPLNEDTRGMINADLLSLMKPTAFLVNTARGAIVNQADLTVALQAGWIAGAGLDVFDQEPLPADDPLTRMDNVILSPHALAWTDDLYHDTSIDSCKNILAVFRGEVPRYTVNRAVVDRPGFQSKLKTLRDHWAAHGGDN